jgi:hypothetical protein
MTTQTAIRYTVIIVLTVVSVACFVVVVVSNPAAAAAGFETAATPVRSIWAFVVHTVSAGFAHLS